MKINNKQKEVIYVQIFFAFSGVVNLLHNVRNILPPSTGPIGNKLNNPTPKLITYNHWNNWDNHKNIVPRIFEPSLNPIFTGETETPK